MGPGAPDLGDGPLVAQIRRVAPLLAELMTDGVEATLGEPLEVLVGQWLAAAMPALDLPGAASEAMAAWERSCRRWRERRRETPRAARR